MTNHSLTHEIQETKELIEGLKGLLKTATELNKPRNIARIEREIIIEKDRLVRLQRQL